MQYKVHNITCHILLKKAGDLYMSGACNPPTNQNNRENGIFLRVSCLKKIIIQEKSNYTICGLFLE